MVSVNWKKCLGISLAFHALALPVLFGLTGNSRMATDTENVFILLPSPENSIAEKPKQQIERPSPVLLQSQPQLTKAIESPKKIDPQSAIVTQPRAEPAPIVASPAIAPGTNDFASANVAESHLRQNREVVESTVAKPAPQLNRSTIAQPKYRENPEPQYPSAAKHRRQEGSVLLEVSVNKNGSAAKVAIKQSSGFSLLDDAARDAVSHWQFEPAKNNEEPVASSVEVPVAFKLSK